jgi:hypothetical protein
MRTFVLLVVMVMASACIPYAGKRTPQLPKPRVVPEITGSPEIHLTVVDNSSEPELVVRCIEYVKKKFPSVSGPAEQVADPDYRIVLTVENTLNPMDEATGDYWMLLPHTESYEVTVKAAVINATCRQLATFESIGRRRNVYHPFLIFTFPVAGPFMPIVQWNMWKNSFRDVMIQATQAIADDQRGHGRPPEPNGRESNESNGEPV